MVMTKPAGTGVKWRCEVSEDTIVYSEPVNVDATGREIRIQTGEPVDPPLEKEYYDERHRFSFRTDTVDDTHIDLCRGNVNNAALTVVVKGRSRTFATGTYKLMDATKSIVYEADGTASWQVTYVFGYRKDTWSRRIQAKSFRHLSSGKLVPNTNDDGQVLETPQFLNAAGTDWVRPGAALPDPLEFDMEDAVDFAGLMAGITNIP